MSRFNGIVTGQVIRKCGEKACRRTDPAVGLCVVFYVAICSLCVRVNLGLLVIELFLNLNSSGVKWPLKK